MNNATKKWAPAFVSQYLDAQRAGFSMSEFAILIGVTYQTAYAKYRRLLAAGYELPPLRSERGLQAEANRKQGERRDREFIVAYRAALNDGHTMRDLARCLGVTYTAAAARASRLRSWGEDLPPLRRKRRRRSRPASQLPSQPKRAAAKRVHASVVTPLVQHMDTHFTITVGG